MIPAPIVGMWQRQQRDAYQARLRRALLEQRVREALKVMRVD